MHIPPAKSRRTTGTIIAAALGCVVVALAPGVHNSDPLADAPRPPALASMAEAQRETAIVRLRINEIVQAVQQGDTAVLSSIMKEDVVPSGERASALAAGCKSIGTVIGILRALRSPVERLTEPPLPVWIERSSISFDTASDTTARVTLQVRFVSKNAPGRSSVRVGLLRNNGRIDVARADGLLATLCAMER